MTTSRVLVVGDCHCPAMRPEYPDFLWETYKEWKCNRVVFIGDVVDWGSISYHEKNPSEFSFTEERDKARAQVAILYKMFPKADWMLGNHDDLPKRKTITAGMGEDLLRPTSEYWRVPGWRVHPRWAKLDIDGTLYMHGDRGKGGMQAAWKNSRDLFRSTVQGHCHTEMGVWWWVNDDFRVFGMNTGTGVDDDTLAMLYNKTCNRRSALGCGIVLAGTNPYIEPLLLEGKYAKR